jgi:hypothetical protein
LDTAALSAIRSNAGRKGGRVCLNKYGVRHMVELGRKGGRPRLPECEETSPNNRRGRH